MPALSIDSDENVAMPLTALTLVVPARLPPPGFVPIESVTVAVDDVTVFPEASWIATVTDGEMVAVDDAVVGCCTNATLLGAPTATLKAELVAPVRPVAAAVSV